MTVKYYELILLVLLAVVSDIKTFKIKNMLILTFMVSGLITNLALSGISGFINAAAATVLPFMVLLLLYMPKMLGAGDIKLFCAIGAISGTAFVLNTILYSFLSGGFIALVIIIFRRSAKARASNLLAYIKSCFLSRSLLLYTDIADRSDCAKFRFTSAIACGSAITMLTALTSP